MTVPLVFDFPLDYGLTGNEVLRDDSCPTAAFFTTGQLAAFAQAQNPSASGILTTVGYEGGEALLLVLPNTTCAVVMQGSIVAQAQNSYGGVSLGDTAVFNFGGAFKRVAPGVPVQTTALAPMVAPYGVSDASMASILPAWHLETGGPGISFVGLAGVEINWSYVARFTPVLPPAATGNFVFGRGIFGQTPF